MGIWSRLKRTFRDDGRIEEIQEELDFHVEMDARSGASPRDARLRLGNPARIREETREAAALFQARRAASLDPVTALREE